MSTQWTPWHKVVQLRDDVKNGTLAMKQFAADLYDVAMGRGDEVYRDPEQFFTLTHATLNLRRLARDVVRRLAGQSDKAVRQLVLTYGGGKTHALITLYHLANDPANLPPNQQTINEFKTEMDLTGDMPKARIAILPFDKMDVEKGMECRAPNGEVRLCKYPWTALAWQIAGAEGLQIIGSEGEERDTSPTENWLEKLLSYPQNEGLATLVLIDEVLMWVHDMVQINAVWRDRSRNFFQHLTNAASKVDTCAVVASLLAADPTKNDELGHEIEQELADAVNRRREEPVQPVEPKDVAELLRRRFFKPHTIKEHGKFLPHVQAALLGIEMLDDETKKKRSEAEAQFLNSYPFHPDLTEVFYARWTGLRGFQQTRGVLRTFAMALRDAATWDNSPLVGANVFLREPGQEGLSDAARELTSIATTASEAEGAQKADWAAIMTVELGKARTIQETIKSLKFREAEQAVFATFLYSQPIGQKAKATTRDLMVLLGATRPYKIDLQKALTEWASTSWFLDESVMGTPVIGMDGEREVPKAWRLGPDPNLKQMHDEALKHLDETLVKEALRKRIEEAKSLTGGVHGIKVHTLPKRPEEIKDDGYFHYAVLGEEAASDAGKPSARASKFIDETTTPDRPRVYRNAVVLAVPSNGGIDTARQKVKDLMAWEEVQRELKGQPANADREQRLATMMASAQSAIPQAIQQAYNIVVTVNKENKIEAFRIAVENKPLFPQIKADANSRIRDESINAEALLPGDDSPYNLWADDQVARRVVDLVNSFAQFPRLPKMLNRAAILETLKQGCLDGLFALRLTRPDQTFHTWWKSVPDDTMMEDEKLEVVLPKAAELTDLPPSLMAPGALHGLWDDKDSITLADARAFFDGAHQTEIQREGYTEPVTVPKAEAKVVDETVRGAVRQGTVWLTSNGSSLLGEDVPEGLLTPDARLHVPPSPLSPSEILPENLPSAWPASVTTVQHVATALADAKNETLPWITVRTAIDGAFKAGLLERTPDSGPWPCDAGGAAAVKVRGRHGIVGPFPVPPTPIGGRSATADLNSGQIMDLADNVDEIIKTAAGYMPTFRLTIAFDEDNPVPDDVVDQLNAILSGISPSLVL